MITLYDAARCPFCARVRIVLAEKAIPYETVEIDLADRPSWLYEMNPAGKVPVLDEDGWILPESAVIDEFLNERFPDPPLWPDDPGERAAGRLLVFRFDDFSKPYYAAAARRGRRARPLRGRARVPRRAALRSALAERPRVRPRRRRVPAMAVACTRPARHPARSRGRRSPTGSSASCLRPSVAAEQVLVAAL